MSPGCCRTIGISLKVIDFGRGKLKYRISLIFISLLVIGSALSGQESDMEIDDSGSVTEAIETVDLEAGFLINDDQGEAGGSGIATFSTWNIIRMVLILAAVIAVIYVIFYFLKKSSAGKSTDRTLINILGSQSLSSNRNLHLVKIGEQIFLIGSSENSVNLISEISDRESIDALMLEVSSEGTVEKKSFAGVLNSIFKPAVLPDSSAVTVMNSSLGFMQRQRERLKKM